MRTRSLAVPVVLMLIAMAMLPGICFSYSLSSSVTSFNNQVIIDNTDDLPITFYEGNVKLEDPSSLAGAFSKADIGVQTKKINNTDRLVTQSALVRMTEDGLKLKVSKDCSISFSLKYSDNSPNQVLGKVNLTLTNTESNNTYDATATWSTTTAALPKTAEVKINNVIAGEYTVKMEIMGDSTTAVTDYTTQTANGETTYTFNPASVDMTVKATSGIQNATVSCNGIKIGFTATTKSYEGITIVDKINSDDQHTIVESDDEDKKGWLEINRVGDDSFAGKKASSETTLNFDGNLQFKLYFDTGGKNGNTFTVNIWKKANDVGDPDLTVTLDGKNGPKVLYVGSGGDGSTLDSVTWFSGTVTVKVSGYEGAASPIYMYVIPNENTTQTQSSEKGSDTEIMTVREEEA